MGSGTEFLENRVFGIRKYHHVIKYMNSLSSLKAGLIKRILLQQPKIKFEIRGKINNVKHPPLSYGMHDCLWLYRKFRR